ncbi:23S rRNA (uracil(1939)-C(5))-methyltransferase RlmD [Raoultibacter massiliensis]|uniref:23S rRNA (uracil(1939)-C(5))-methyltransferase RlmD n=1 Tax=Raoultibacter massiliensis TaxID=1852371 RepID=UPI001FE86AD8
MAKEAPACPVEDRCGACQLLHVPYERQLAKKQEAMAELFDGLAVESTVMHPIAGMGEPYHYRNKVVSPYAPGRRIKPKAAKAAKGDKRASTREDKHAPTHEILCGMYAAGTHRIVPTDACLIENRTAKKIILAVRDLMPSFRIEPYREDANTGFLRHAIVRVGHTSGEVLVTLVTNGRQFPGSKALVRELVKRCPEITSIVQNVNTRQTNVILGTDEIRLYGPGFILDKLCGLSFRISSQSFYQVNASQTEVLYRRAIELARLTGDETVIDAYCGTGTIGLVAACGAEQGKGAKRVIGVDETVSAIRDARANAQHNGIENAEFVACDAGIFMRDLAAEATERIDVVLMDPPRSGATEDFLKALVALSPQRVVYISCNPETQARDVAYLVERGYAVEAVRPVDMFPHTEHVENIVVCCNNT